MRRSHVLEITAKSLDTNLSGERKWSPRTGKVLHTAECWERACHHVLAERWVRRWFKGADVHCLENLVVVTPALHARLTAAENKLFAADWVGYKATLNRLGFPLEMVDRAFHALLASEKK